MSLATGYFGIPGTMRTTRVHVVEGGRPICGVRLHPDQAFQWCAHGVQQQYLECGRCRTVVAARKKKLAPGVAPVAS